MITRYGNDETKQRPRFMRKGTASIRATVPGQAIVVALLLASAGCSSAGSTAQGTQTTGTVPSGASTSTASTSTTAAPTDSATTPSSVAPTSTAANPSRPDDACTMLTSDEVAAAVGTPGPFTGAHEDPADDGSPVWGCTWGTHASAADVRETTAERFANVPNPADITTVPVTGIGDKARLDTMTPDGRNPDLWFTAGGRYYVMEVTVSRSELGAENAAREKEAEQTLAKTLAGKLAGR